MRCKYFLAGLLLLIACDTVKSQTVHYNITILDSTETYFEKIQKEIHRKEPGTFSDTFYNASHDIVQVNRYTNFTSKESAGSIWTYVDKYLFNDKQTVEKIEHWKTDNVSQMCKCGSWQFRKKGILVLVQPYPKCTKKGFNCDTTAEKPK